MSGALPHSLVAMIWKRCLPAPVRRVRNVAAPLGALLVTLPRDGSAVPPAGGVTVQP